MENTIKEEIKEPYKADEITLIDDCKDFLLTKLTKQDIEEFIKELEGELSIRECTAARYSRYVLDRELLKLEFMNKCRKDLDELKESFNKQTNNLRKDHINDDDTKEMDESNEEDEEIEEPPKVTKRGRKPKAQRGRKKKL
jgi:hypothetical protein